ncbi:MAG: bifunctional 4-hydroxy-2-oxoglutarate aldolase/2-dehydro-3-deoxy-phosphogluconate aldolase [Chloroflexota bacterium]
MDRADTLAKIQQIGLLAVLRGPSEDITINVVDALVAGGVTGIEVTYSTPNAPAVLRTLREKYGSDLLLGMGTLTEPRHATEAAEAGANFLVSPHTEAELAAAMRDTGLPLMMGALTPTEVVLSQKLGSDVVKLFPGSLGGPAHMRSLKAPFPDIPMMPTGGVSQDNVAEWFDAGAVAVGAGSKLAPKNLTAEGRFDEITAIAKDFVQAIAAARAQT